MKRPGDRQKKKASVLIVLGILLMLFSGRGFSPYLRDSAAYMQNADGQAETGLYAAEEAEETGPSATEEAGEQFAAQAEEAELLRVVDGDTIWVRLDGEKKKVRFLQINTPESVHSDAKKNNRFGKAASAHLKELLSDTNTVWLTKDSSDTDQYGRLLRLVWTEKPKDAFSDEELREKCLNARQILDGYALTVVFDDYSYEEIFSRFLKEAKKERRGLWADAEWRRFARESE